MHTLAATPLIPGGRGEAVTDDGITHRAPPLTEQGPRGGVLRKGVCGHVKCWARAAVSKKELFSTGAVMV